MLAPGCGGHRADRTHPTDPFVSVQVAPLPVGSLSGSNVLLLAVGGVVVGDSGSSLPELEGRRTALLESANAALDTAVRRDGREVNWMGLPEQRQAARRNPTLGLDPDRFATAYLVDAAAASVPDPLWGQIRSLAAITGARFAVVPPGVRIGGSSGALVASYIMVVADARTGAVIFRARATGRPAATPEAALASAAATVIATPLH
jgi:hypothetical protein